MIKPHSFLPLLATAWLGNALTAGAAPVVRAVASGPNTPSTTTDELAYASDASDADLLHGITGTGGNWNANGSSPNGLNDGIHGADSDTSAAAALANAAWSRDGSYVSFREFELGTGPGGLGYDITGIQSIAAWQGAGFSNQRYEVRVKMAGNTFFTETPVATVNFQPFTATLNEGGATRVRVTDDTGVLATGVTAIRLDVLDTTGNTAGGTVFREFDVFGTAKAGPADTVPPVLVSLAPEDNSGQVAAGAVLAATFHEIINLGSGSITLKNLTAGTDTVINLPDPRVNVSGRTLVIRPGILLAPASHYAIRISNGAVTDSSGNAFAGIADDSTWDLTTSQDSTQGGSPLNANFAADVSSLDLLNGLVPTTTGWNTGNGASTSKLNDGIHGGALAESGSVVQGAWTTVGATATYNLGSGPNGTGYDLFSIQSIAAWENVSFGNQAWTVEVKPVGGSFTTLGSVNYQPLTGSGGTKVVMNGAGPVLATGIESIRFTANQVNGGANAGAFVWRELDVFGEASAPSAPDNTPPALVTFNPADGASGVLPRATLAVTFDENITAGSGSIRLRNLENSMETLIPVTDSHITISGPTLSIKPSTKLAAQANYAVRIEAGAIMDFQNNAFAGISNDITWNFTTTTDPLRIMPMGDSITAGYTDNPNWNEPYWYGYRSGLYNRLHDAGYDFVFVGQSTELPSHVNGTTPPADLAALGQNAHNGYGGQTVSHLNANILNWLATDDPDVILLKIGTNSQDTAGLDTLVNTIVTTKPELRLVIALIIPRYTYHQGTVDYNNYIRDTLVPNYQGQGKHVTLVNQYVNFLTNPSDLASIDQSLFSNGINHPTNAGYDKMAQTWFQGIEALGLDSTTFNGWIANPAYGIPAGSRGFTDDPDGDGLGNGLEAWMGTHPGEANQGLSNLAMTGGNLSFSHPLNPQPPAGIEAAYEWSVDLEHWYRADGNDGPASGHRVTCVLAVSGSNATVTVTSNQTATKVFVRMKAVPGVP